MNVAKIIQSQPSQTQKTALRKQKVVPLISCFEEITAFLKETGTNK
jgi:hypothetical protein